MKEFYDDAIKMIEQVENTQWGIKKLQEMHQASSWVKWRDDAKDIPGLIEVMEDFEAKLKELDPYFMEIGHIWSSLSKYVDEIEEMGLEDEWLKPEDTRE